MSMRKSAYKKFRIDGDRVQEVGMLLPMFIGFLLFTIYPIIWAIRWAWFDYSGFGTPVFVGFENFVRAFTRDPMFWQSLVNTSYLAFAKLLLEMPLAIILAVLVNKKIKAASFFRVIYFMPTVMSVAVVGIIFSIMFSAYNGIINALLQQVNIISKNVDFFAGRWSSLTVMLFVSLWTTFGINMLYFLMGLQNIPNELYESADIDGANTSQKFIHITLPLLAPTMQTVFLLSMLGTMRITDLILVMTNGQPGGTTEVVMSYVSKYFFQYGDAGSVSQFGYGSALIMIVAVFLAIITAIYFKVSKKMTQIF